MKNFRLGVFGRSMTVATLFWLFGWTTYQTREDLAVIDAAYVYNLQMQCKNPFDSERCAAAKENWYPQPTGQIVASRGLEALSYAAIGWIVAMLLYGSFRWILAGRSAIRRNAN